MSDEKATAAWWKAEADGWKGERDRWRARTVEAEAERDRLRAVVDVVQKTLAEEETDEWAAADMIRRLRNQLDRSPDMGDG